MRSLNKPGSAVLLLALAMAWSPCHAERADRDKPVHLEADQVNIDDAKQISTFEGSVVLVQGTMTIRSDKLVVVQAKDGNTHGTATGNPASFRQKREGVDEYIEGYGNRIEYDTRDNTIEFIGNARMTRQQDEVRGGDITYNSKTEVFQVHSTPGKDAAAGGTAAAHDRNRVHVTIQPRHTAPAPAPAPLTIRPDQTLKIPEENR